MIKVYFESRSQPQQWIADAINHLIGFCVDVSVAVVVVVVVVVVE